MLLTKLKYGTSEIILNLPSRTTPIDLLELSPESDPSQFFPAISLPTSGTVAIIVSDKTRLCEYPLYLPLLTDALIQSGIRHENIVFYIAYGTHPHHSESENLATYGDVYKDFRFIHHDSRDQHNLKSLGNTSFGTEILVRKDLFDHVHLITFGALSHHYFAGYGGGRKLLFPGLAGYNAILHNHRLYLNFKNRSLDPLCHSGNLETNPIAMDLEEINNILPQRLELHGILNSKGEVCEIIYGRTYNDFRNACKVYDKYYRSKISQTFDLVLASAGGYPKDINFIQSHKAIQNAASFVKNGGDLVILAECRDGIGNNRFLNLLNKGGEQEIFNIMEKHYENNGGTALSLLSKTKRINIHLVTSLDQEACTLMRIHKTIPSLVQKIVNTATGDIAYIANASMIYR